MGDAEAYAGRLADSHGKWTGLVGRNDFASDRRGHGGVAPKVLGERLAGNPGFMNALIAASGGRLAAHAGGVLILDAQQRGIGAMGISGDTGDNDEKCALAGLHAAGLQFSA